MTPLQMGIMLAAHTGCSEYDTSNPGTAIYNQLRNELFNNDLIELTDKNDYGHRLTSKGAFWLNAVLSTPFPVEKKTFYIPMEEK